MAELIPSLNSCLGGMTSTSEEEVRKLYVALTRAKSHLLVSYHRENALSEALQARTGPRVAERQHA